MGAGALIAFYGIPRGLQLPVFQSQVRHAPEFVGIARNENEVARALRLECELGIAGATDYQYAPVRVCHEFRVGQRQGAGK